jgi:DNA-nicking Smr family endonuclease
MTTGPKRRGARHKYSVPDYGLWRDIARHITPLRPRREEEADKGSGKPEPKPEYGSPDSPEAPTPRPSRPANLPGHPNRLTGSKRDPAGPPLSGIDRRMQRRLIRGAAEIDARLDLHGESIESARVRLQRFLAEARLQGHRLVLVITGKGASPFTGHTLHGTSHFHSPERQGRLRRLVLEWLSEPEFRVHVSGFQPAHPRHGGGGALYVRLRRPKGHPA